MGQQMPETLYQTEDAGDTLWYSRCRIHSIRQEMQETLYGTAVQETLHGTADAGDTLSDRRSRRHSLGQQMQETLYGTADAGDTL